VTRAALTLAFAAGAGLALQAFVNGRLGESLDSSPLAAAANQGTGLLFLVLVATATGALVRAWRRVRAGARPRLWHLVACANGALYVTVTAAAAPRVGVALLTVALVSGQTGGSLVVDRLGLSPAGRRPMSVARVLGVALAIAAVAIGALGPHADPHLLLLALAVLAGLGMGLAQAAVGHMARLTGDPVVASSVNFALGGAVILVIALAVTGGSPPGGWSAPPEQWIGGLIGAATGVVMAYTVNTLGVLRLMLAIVAGQALGGILVDLVAPAAGENVTLATVVSVLLTFLAVAVSGIVRRRPATTAAIRRSAPAGKLQRGCLGLDDRA
jgi:transporter family-2 protein